MLHTFQLHVLLLNLRSLMTSTNATEESITRMNTTNHIEIVTKKTRFSQVCYLKGEEVAEALMERDFLFAEAERENPKMGFLEAWREQSLGEGERDSCKILDSIDRWLKKREFWSFGEEEANTKSRGKLVGGTRWLLVKIMRHCHATCRKMARVVNLCQILSYMKKEKKDYMGTHMLVWENLFLVKKVISNSDRN